ncbi:MAG TPA: DNA-directed RNA polymerase subunit alpha [Bacteroidales bacterium]|jgi:DNA-directed RNA polymerase subunit alpha|nr:MAG: DNA-directed RNA polymerase subunit alpha [Bacteroidetes bacterium ADurb.Bin028]HNY43415.1 DNA-directed RNA polymerase subunit alpha [Bacteroidales bacterium]HOD88553.1 DNA-directed RNA polymerase subunit alpha [Bacteroidales bacterium]
MAILAFQKPDKVVMLEATDFHGKFEFRPLEPGYGITVGNALRRILLSSLEGFAISSVKIDGVDHEFSTIPGVMEDVTEIVLQLKQIRFKQQIEDMNHELVTVVISGQEEFRAGDIGKFLSGFKILNPDLLICRMNSNVNLRLELNIVKGRGYVSPEDNKSIDDLIGVIPIGSVFTPIRNVKYYIENMRVEQKTDYEKLLIEIDTDGSIHPKDALKEAAKILIQHFMLFSDEKITLDDDDRLANDEFDEEVLRMRQLLKTKLVDLDLSVRALNCLKAAEIDSLGDLVQFNRTDLLKFRNFGKKSLTELENLLEMKNLNFGMDISKYKLDKE